MLSVMVALVVVVMLQVSQGMRFHVWLVGATVIVL